MASKKVNVKWGKNVFQVDADLDESPMVFKSQLFALSGVQPERQKIMFKGKTLSDDSWATMSGLLKDNCQMLMMGSAEAVPDAPSVKTMFLEDMSDAQAAAAFEMPCGLKNLGNTCYMNATLQCLKTVPELTESLRKCGGGALDSADSAQAPAVLSAAVRDLYRFMDAKKSANIAPVILLQVLHLMLPQFSSKDEHGRYMQQDANECWTELVRMFQQKLQSGDAEDPLSAPSVVSRFMAGRFLVKFTNKEADDESVQEMSEDFLQLSCFLSQEVKYVQSGLKSKLREEIVKYSAVLGRDATYQKEMLVSRLPAYLSIQMVRFYYKEREQINAKILKDVKFPISLDLYDMCTSELKEKLQPMRQKMKEADDAKMEELKKHKTGDVSEVNREDNWEQLPFSFADDPGSNNSGFYELQAVMTHKGRSSNSGHYVGWVRGGASDHWWMCDDDEVRPVATDDILKLSGGGDWHCAYVLLYGPRKLCWPGNPMEQNGQNANNALQDTSS